MSKTQKTHESPKEKVWQVVKEKVGGSGAILETQKLGMPRTLESAKQILQYKTTTERRREMRYRIRHIDDN